jgi:MATE family multidrug resistance protein
MMGKNNVPMVCQLIGTFLHIFTCYFFVWRCELGIMGVGIASSVSNSITFTLMLTYTSQLEEIKEAVQWPNKKATQDVCQYLKLGVPSALMLCLEWWAFEAIIIMVGYIGVNEQAANVIIFQMAAFVFMVALGL